MIRVLHLIKSLGRGGAEMLLLRAAPHLDRRRFHFEVAYLLSEWSDLVDHLRSAGLPVTCLDGSRGAGWLRRLRSLVSEKAFDIVHVHSPYAAVGARVALSGRTRICYTEHSVWSGYRPVTRWGNALTFPLNDHVFAVSDHVRESIRFPRPLRGFLPKVETLYHGVDLGVIRQWESPNGVREELGIDEGAPVVGTVGNFTQQKGHPYLLNSLALLRQELPNLRAVFVGAGPRESEVKRLAARLNLDETLVFTGSLPDAPRIAASFDVFVLSSVQEGLSIALIEAMALGLPAVVTRVGGLPEVVRQGVEGFIVPERDPGALAKATGRLLTDRALRQRMGQAARRRASEFDIRSAVRRMEAVYSELAR